MMKYFVILFILSSCAIVEKKSNVDFFDRTLLLREDNSVQKLKGMHRPIQDQDSRSLIMASLHVVSAVVIFEEDTPLDLIKQIEPDFLVKGGDWEPSKIVGADIVTGYGGQVISIPFIDGYSTTSIESKIKLS